MSGSPGNNDPVWERLSYDKDALIEASAGTGKTYTLEHIVLKLVLEKEIPLKKILLVTFTDKAAGELRDRIRGSFEKQLEDLPEDDPSGRKKLLVETLRHFDEATISTIHSFCQRMLREYAFENGIPRTTKILASTRELAEQAIREVILSEDFQCGHGFDFLAFATGDKTLDDFIRSMAESLSAFRSDRWDRALESLAPDEDPGTVAETGAALAKELDGKSLLDWARADLTINKRSLSRAEREYAALERLLPDLLAPNYEAFPKALATYRDLVKKENYLNPAVNGRGPGARLLDLHPELPAFLVSLDAEIVRRRREGLVEIFTRARRRFRHLYDEGGGLSYNDMILQARDALFGEHGGMLLEKLRDAYQVALVDEFQDTDGVQWDIFRKIFSEAPDDDARHFLIVVGDPKQAIYGFRGADLQTYLEARRTICPREEDVARISASYRSTRPLLDCFNRLFMTEGWFDPPDTRGGVTCSPVEYPDHNERFDGYDDSCPMEPVGLIESLPPGVMEQGKKGFGNTNACLPVFSENAAREIKRLCADGTFLVYDKDVAGNRRPLRYGDFAFLVRKANNADPIKKALRAHGIPYSHYKEEGVYDSEEGEAVMALLELVADPTCRGKRAAALLTSFFGVPVGKLEEALRENVPAFTRLLDKWAGLARERRWARLFESFLEETRLWCPTGRDDALFDRRYGTTRQILDDLLTACGTTAQSVADLADGLRKLRSGGEEAGEDGKLRQKETEADRVQIMTMHASKGLEFPVVFIAYGFSEDPYSGHKICRGECRVPSLPGDPDVGTDLCVRRRVFHMDGSPLTDADPDGALAKATDEVANEVRRLLYVALTRAQYKVCLPWSARAGTAGIGSAGSPLRGGFLCQALLGLYPDGFEGKVLDFARKEDGEKTEAAPGDSAAGDGAVRLPGFPSDLRSRRVHWDSFSSIHHAAADAVPVPVGSRQALDGPAKESDEPAPSEEVEVVLAPRPTLLPRGTASGTVFHELMEDLCNGDGSDGRPGFELGDVPFEELFAEGKGLVVLALAERLLKIHGLADRKDDETGDTTAKTLVRMAWNALNASITIGGTTFRLAEIGPGDRRAEVDFVVDQKAILGEGPNRNGLFNGSIDLLFRLPGEKRYFILDWKTNSLPAYGRDEVRAAMDAANYHLQYQLYTLAASAWLGSGRLAGATYLFVRGGESGPDAPGVFARPYDEVADGAGYREAVAGNLEAARKGEDNR